MASGGRVVSYSTSYSVGTEPVRLTVTIGEGDFGSTLVQLGDETLGHERTFCKILGSGKDIVGKKLQIFSVVTDTNLQTNRTSVTYRLEGGPQTLEHTLSFTVSQERETVDYKADIELVAVKP